jgi:predicted amidohydrolase
VRVAVVQHDIAWEDPAASFAGIAPWIEVAAGTGARLVVLAEMFSTGFSMRTEVTAEPSDGPSTAFLRDAAVRHGVWLAGSVTELPAGAGKPFNTLVLAGPDRTVHRYRKIHPSGFGDEDKHFAAGTELTTVEVEGVRLTLFVCYDLRFADEFWVTAGDTDCYLVVANWPAARREHWRTLLRARAIENQAYVVACNRVGEGGGLSYTGDSVVLDPWGEPLAAASQAETVLVADVDPAVVAATRRRFPILADRRTAAVPAR